MYILIDHLKHVLNFVRVADSGSFTAAAHRLDISTAAVSKSVSLLEAKLGVKLLNRTTRNLSLTDDGELLLQRCRHILLEVEAAEAEVTGASVSPRGKLRVHAPVGLGRKVIMPALLSLTARYPELSINADFSDRMPNLAEEGLDATIRIGVTTDSRVIAKTLSRLRYVTCASPAYLATHGAPATPDELERHNCLAYVQWQTGRYHEWDFQKGDERYTITPGGTLNVNHPEAILDAVVAGAGIARMASFIAESAVLDGRLKLVLTDWMAPGAPVQLVYLPNRHLSPRIRAFVDAMVEALPPQLPWEQAMGL
ncbi:LysR family transcriptional regulator [Achromobacter xylosoxidans]|uniref:LysR family transcriptional regulator n=1 Tax=Alcaligenes xylosoxydans xylosoxydans TaxID=85698 RepID=A0A424WAV4_ALCXX|nr:LysR family transcriptional regulator [Achromobacter xylosoxidans]MBC9906357.1 LysR family transcriptional regulator [Achromobacter xylosoxidans]MBD0870447.1 LysR family transcriptional regulator [Achromobacter xylosoxidans]QNP83996.1 LysR family transcriptional regulator [Achromobacter xylosoxidans]RPJ90459.1 LysR family transcriptional regulator [Achromobacter xylosoxidans]